MLSGILVALFLSGVASFAQSQPVSRGTSLTLNTSTNRVVLPSQAPTEINVSVSFRNRSKIPIVFEFDSIAAAAARFEFLLYEADTDTPIFSTLGAPSKRSRQPTETRQSLPGLTSWTATAAIPTIINGNDLAQGTYRIEVVLLADPSVAAATFFQVHTSSEPPRPPIFERPPKSSGVLVSEIDSLSATLLTKSDGSRAIQVQAAATVPHPGFTRNPRLLPSPVAPTIGILGGSILFLRFEVDPPDPGFFYPMVLASVNASAEFPYRNETMVWVHAAKSRKTAEIIQP